MVLFVAPMFILEIISLSSALILPIPAQYDISAKIESLLITDEYFEANVHFKFPEDMELNSKTFSYGFAVYDENKNIYIVSTRIHPGSNEKFDKIYNQWLFW